MSKGENLIKIKTKYMRSKDLQDMHICTQRERLKLLLANPEDRGHSQVEKEQV